jgi:hypothetical protein
MAMGKKGKAVYAFHGCPAGLDLPGVDVHVLGPPTIRQSESIRKQRSRDKDQFWHLQAGAMRLAAGETEVGGDSALFQDFAVKDENGQYPVDARWLIYHARKLRDQQLLQLVRILDTAMNNTSVILLFSVGSTRLLFPGDAQIENWEYALSDAKSRALLADVDVYKVGHHGSLNATPKELWGMFKHRSTDEKAPQRLKSVVSTMAGKHGSESSKTEVPRRTLMAALKNESHLFSTEELGNGFFHDTPLTFARR